MEEVYVIRLRGVPSTESSSSAGGAGAEGDLVRGLGAVHLVLGLLVTVLGVLRWGAASAAREPPAAVAGAALGPLFAATGVCALARPRRLRALFWLSVVSLAGAAAMLGLCLGAAARHHATPRLLGDAAHLAANGAVAALAEGAVALLSAAVAGSAVWSRLRRFAPSPRMRKVIVATEVLGGGSGGGDVLRHVSPHCVVSLHGPQPAAMQRVHEYLDELSSSFSDPPSSSLHEDERDLGLDSEHWGNDVVAVVDDSSRDTADTSLSSS